MGMRYVEKPGHPAVVGVGGILFEKETVQGRRIERLALFPVGRDGHAEALLRLRIGDTQIES
jgi:hypothetical protein